MSDQPPTRDERQMLGVAVSLLRRAKPEIYLRSHGNPELVAEIERLLKAADSVAPASPAAPAADEVQRLRRMLDRAMASLRDVVGDYRMSYEQGGIRDPRNTVVSTFVIDGVKNAIEKNMVELAALAAPPAAPPRPQPTKET